MIQKFTLVLALIAGICFKTTAQDVHFSQQYAARLQINPAFAGISSDYSITAGHRNQWPSLRGSFTTSYLSADYRFKEQKSAVGLVASADESGNAGLTRLQVGGIYAYHTDLSDFVTVSAAVQAMYGSQRIDFSSLVFGDQLSDNGFVNASTQERDIFDPVNYASFATGAVVYTRQFWLSVAAAHLNQPDLGFASGSRLPTRITINTGYRFYISSYFAENRIYEFSVIPSITYTRQGIFNKTEIGLYTNYTPLTFGLVYRGISFTNSFASDHAIAAIAGINLEKIRLAYSYDIGLSGITAKTGGAHEVSVTFEELNLTKITKKLYTDKKYRRISCPAF
ncbi:MAG: PorP/SprF family type IX secretion system membrane protein [Hymenobacteraceae bacterium]|nr:PorP/SprF family type IX secretion system membrane protein [Hymenobacteraceae bacterium]